jgi:hypothetical protein
MPTLAQLCCSSQYLSLSRGTVHSTPPVHACLCDTSQEGLLSSLLLAILHTSRQGLAQAGVQQYLLQAGDRSTREKAYIPKKEQAEGDKRGLPSNGHFPQ